MKDNQRCTVAPAALNMEDQLVKKLNKNCLGKLKRDCQTKPNILDMEQHLKDKVATKNGYDVIRVWGSEVEELMSKIE